MDLDISFQSLSPHLVSIEKFARMHYSDDDVHGIGHVMRVFRNASLIQAVEGGADPLIRAIIWFHDIGRTQEKDLKTHHAVLSTRLADPFLQSLGISDYIRQEIRHGILAHSFSIGGEATTLEAQIVSDADKLDAIGAFGIYRACVYQYQHHQGVQDVLVHFEDKLLTLDEQLYLPTSRQIATQRKTILVQFKTQLQAENLPLHPTKPQ